MIKYYDKFYSSEKNKNQNWIIGIKCFSQMLFGKSRNFILLQILKKSIICYNYFDAEKYDYKYFEKIIIYEDLRSNEYNLTQIKKNHFQTHLF